MPHSRTRRRRLGAVQRAELEFDRDPQVEDEGVDRRVARAYVALFLAWLLRGGTSARLTSSP